MTRRRTPNRIVWLEVALYCGFGLVVLTGLVAGGLYATGYFDGIQEPSRDGQLACPALARPVNAYAAISRDDLINPQTGQLNIVWLPEATAENVLRDLSLVLGRVAKRDKVPGMALTEADLFPAGTRPGLAAGIPPGMQAVSIETDEIDGLSLLRMGDRFDLYAALPSDPDLIPQTEHAVLLGGIKPPDTRAGQLAKQTGVRVLVSGGQMVALTKGSKRSTEGQQELVVPADRRTRDETTIVATIGVAPEEVTPLTEALGLETKILCVTHSGRSDDETNVKPPVDLSGLTPIVAPYRSVEAFQAIGQEDLVDPVSGRLNEYYFDPARLESGWLTSFGDLVGRVVRRNINPGEPITEDDLLPVGTRPGIVAGAPAGTVILEASSDRLAGIQSLSVGDRLTIYQQLPVEVRPAFSDHEWATIQGGRQSPEDEQLQQILRSGLQLVAEGVLLLGQRDRVAPAEDDQEENESDSEPVKTLVLAVPSDRVVSFAQALASENVLTVTAEASESDGQAGDRAPFAFSELPIGRDSEQLIPVSKYDSSKLPTQFATQDSVADDMVAVPVTARSVPPFTRLSPEDFVDPTTGRLRQFYFPADQVDDSWILSVKDLIDRVTGAEITSGRVIASKHLLPEGTNPGKAAGVPSGYAALEVTSLQVDGLEVPNVLDRIDLVGARPVHSFGLQERAQWASTFDAETFYAPRADDVYSRADNRTLAASAIVLHKEYREFEIREESSTETIGEEVQLTEDGATRRGVQRKTEPTFVTRKGLACTLAVPEASVPVLLEALSVQRLVGDDESGTDSSTSSSRSSSSDSSDDSTTLNEVAIYAVTHSSRPAVNAPTIPTIDVVRDWLERWSHQFRRYRSQTRTAPLRVVDQIRGSGRSTAQYIGNDPVSERTAAREIYGQTLERVLPGAADQSDSIEQGTESPPPALFDRVLATDE